MLEAVGGVDTVDAGLRLAARGTRGRARTAVSQCLQSLSLNEQPISIWFLLITLGVISQFVFTTGKLGLKSVSRFLFLDF